MRSNPADVKGKGIELTLVVEQTPRQEIPLYLDAVLVQGPVGLEQPHVPLVPPQGVVRPILGGLWEMESKHLHLHLRHLADAFIQSNLQKVHLLKERQQYITVVPEDKNRAVFSSIPIYETNRTGFIIAKLPA